MPYNTKTVKRDGSGITPVPQHFNPTADDYEAILGRNGASRVELYGPDGNPISTSSGKLAVRATEIESLLNDIKGKDFATQTTLAQILAKIIAAPATEAKQETIALLLSSLDGKDYSTLAKQNEILTKLAALEAKLNSALDVQLSGRKVGVYKTELSLSDSVAVSGSELTKIEPTGYIVKPFYLSFYIPAPVGATTGYHKIAIGFGKASAANDYQGANILFFEVVYNKAITYTLPTTLALPAGTTEGFNRSVDTINKRFTEGYFDATESLWIYYFNQTDAVQSGERKYTVYGKKEAVI